MLAWMNSIILPLSLIHIFAFDREFARSQKIPVEIFEYVLMMFIALTIVALSLIHIYLGGIQQAPAA